MVLTTSIEIHMLQNFSSRERDVVSDYRPLNCLFNNLFWSKRSVKRKAVPCDDAILFGYMFLIWLYSLQTDLQNVARYFDILRFGIKSSLCFNLYVVAFPISLYPTMFRPMITLFDNTEFRGPWTNIANWLTVDACYGICAMKMSSKRD